MRLSPELDFLRACCMGSGSPDFPARIRDLSNKISRWSALIEKLALQGVDSLAYGRLQEAGRGAVPEAVMGVLADRAAQNAASCLRQISESADILPDFCTSGLPAVPSNGPLVSAALYGNLSFSRSAELEFVIRAADRELARTVLERRGYILGAPLHPEGTPLDPGQDAYRFKGPGAGFIELRWRIALPELATALHLDYLLAGCKPTEISGVECLTIAPEDLLILFCARGAKGGWERWIRLCDLDALMRSNPGLDWKAVAERATALGLGRVLRFSLILAQELLEAPVPQRVLEEAHQDADAERLAAAAGASLLDLGISQTPQPSIPDQSNARLRDAPESALAQIAVAMPSHEGTLQDDDSPAGKLEVRAYRLSIRGGDPVPAPRGRTWMDQTEQRFAQRCLPLLMANQAGWHILNTHAIEVEWDGRHQVDAVRIRVLSGEGDCPVHSHFGHGIVTWSIPFLFRTSPGYNLWVRGPANSPKDGVHALEGLVETDWSPATFTMNWQMTRPGHVVRFEEGEPICCVLPQRRGELEEFDAVIEDIGNSPEENERYRRWADSRKVFLDLMKSADARPREGWQKHYFHGEGAAGERFEAHQNKLKLRAFRKVRSSRRNSGPPSPESQ